MFVKSNMGKEVRYNKKGNSIVLKPKAITYIADSLGITPKDLMDCYGDRITIMSQKLIEQVIKEECAKVPSPAEEPKATEPELPQATEEPKANESETDEVEVKEPKVEEPEATKEAEVKELELPQATEEPKANEPEATKEAEVKESKVAKLLGKQTSKKATGKASNKKNKANK